MYSPHAAIYTPHILFSSFLTSLGNLLLWCFHFFQVRSFMFTHPYFHHQVTMPFEIQRSALFAFNKIQNAENELPLKGRKLIYGNKKISEVLAKWNNTLARPKYSKFFYQDTILYLVWFCKIESWNTAHGSNTPGSSSQGLRLQTCTTMPN